MSNATLKRINRLFNHHATANEPAWREFQNTANEARRRLGLPPVAPSPMPRNWQPVTDWAQAAIEAKQRLGLMT